MTITRKIIGALCLWLSTLTTAAMAQSLPNDIDGLRSVASDIAAANAVAFRDEWNVPMYAALIDLDAATVSWPLFDGETLVADITLLMVAQPDGPATWGWALENPPMPLSPALEVLREHGQRNGITELITAQVDLDKNDAARLAFAAILAGEIIGVGSFSPSAYDGTLIVAYHPPQILQAGQ